MPHVAYRITTRTPAYPVLFVCLSNLTIFPLISLAFVDIYTPPLIISSSFPLARIYQVIALTVSSHPSPLFAFKFF